MKNGGFVTELSIWLQSQISNNIVFVAVSKMIRNNVKMNCIPKKIMKKLILAKSQCQVYKLCIIWGNLIFNGPCIRKTAKLQKDPDTNKCCIRDQGNSHYHPTFTKKYIIGFCVYWLHSLEIKWLEFNSANFYNQYLKPFDFETKSVHSAIKK